MPLTELEELCERAIAEWYASEYESIPEKRRATDVVGLINAGLHIAEYFRRSYPLTEQDFYSKNMTQVKGMSGRKGTLIVRRFVPEARAFGTEAGRTTRGTIGKATRLVERLNALAAELSRLNPQDRGQLADVMQRWLIENPLRAYWQRQRLEPEIDPLTTSPGIIGSIIDAAVERNIQGPVAQHLVGAKLSLKFGSDRVANHSYSSADQQTGRPGDFQLGDTVFHVTMRPASLIMEKVRKNIADGYRVMLLVPEALALAARQIVDGEEDLAVDAITVRGIEVFVGQNLEELAQFDTAQFKQQLRRLLETYNSRVAQVEPDQSLQIQVPANL